MKRPEGALSVSLRWSPADRVPVGRLAMRGARIFFEFDPSFLSRGLEISPLKLKLRPGVFEGPRALSGLHGPFNDSLPDAWGRLLVDRQAERAGLRAAELSLLDRLACVGERGMGALVYAPETPLPPQTGGLDLDALSADAQRLLEGETAALLDQLVVLGGSPGGARPKALIGYDAAKGRVVHGASMVPPGYCPAMVKFRAPGDPEDIGAIEYAYAFMARAAGLRMQPVWLLPAKSGPGYFATARFDRTPDGGRLHAHTLAGVLQTDFRTLGIDYDALLRVTRALTRDEREVAAAFRLMVFNVLAHNRDDHGKQFSFLMDREGGWRFAPAYDLTFSEGPGGQHSTTLAGEGKAPGREVIGKLAKRLGIQKFRVIVDEVAEAVQNWERFAEDAGISRKSRVRIAARIVR